MQEIELRKEELSVLKTQIRVQQERFELDKKERNALLDYLRVQSQAIESRNQDSNGILSPDNGTTSQLLEYNVTLSDKLWLWNKNNKKRSLGRVP